MKVDEKFGGCNSWNASAIRAANTTSRFSGRFRAILGVITFWDERLTVIGIWLRCLITLAHLFHICITVHCVSLVLMFHSFRCESFSEMGII
uniref:Ovule protein n=1 Tax=Parascaris univalens TaxID=6257 RepID=A0A915AR00_PARUN